MPRAEHILQCFSALTETSQALNRNLEFHQLLQFILERMLDVSSADIAGVFILDESGQLQFIGGRDAKHNILGDFALPLSQGIAERLFSNLDTVCVRDIARDPVLRNDVELAKRYVAGIIALPMMRGDGLIGALCIASRSTLLWIDETDLSTLKSITAQLSMATDSAIAYSEIARLSESTEYEVQQRTQQLTEANNWLAQALRQAENDLTVQADNEKAHSRFYAALAHELRSPSQLMLGHAYMMLEDGMEHMTAQQCESLEVIVRTSEHVRDLVTKVLDASKLSEGGMAIDPVPVDIRPIIKEVLESGRGLLTGKEVILAYNYPETLPNVLVDPTRIRQILLNLLANACRYTDAGKIRISATERDGDVVINVADTGTGIADDKLDQLFEPYSQADNTRAHLGTGLGLMITKQLVELHGGKLWVTSKLGVGSVFSFTLQPVLE